MYIYIYIYIRIHIYMYVHRYIYTSDKFKVRLGISWTNADPQWNPVYNAFHRIFCCGNEFVGSFVNMILTRQTCGQRSSRAAGGKRQALALNFSIRIWYMFRESNCRGESDLSLCTMSGLADKFCGQTRFLIGSRHCAAAFFLQVPKLCTDLDLSHFYILTSGTYSKFARKNNFLALGVCFLQPCSSAGRRFAASRSRVQNYRRVVRFVSTIKIRWNAL